MKYLVYLITLLFSTAVAQNPTILQGNYVSNVFGQANFVLNPNAQTSTTNVTVSNATVTRPSPMVTPLVATTEFNVEVTSANGTITWATRSFDAGMKNQNCEARFTYRGFQATSKAQIKQGANVVAELTLTPSASDPRIASINFPCGDLSSATTFVITDSATLSGTHEIGGIYVGLATNQANVAQAEVVVYAKSNTAQAITNGATQTLVLGNDLHDPYNLYNTSNGIFKAKKPGDYVFSVRITPSSSQSQAQWYTEIYKNGSNAGLAAAVTTPSLPDGTANAGYAPISPINQRISLNTGDEVEIKISLASAANTTLQNGYSDMTVTRFPSSSELVVTPETQNVWGGVKYNGNGDFIGSATTYSPVSDTSFSTETLLGHAKAAGSACGLNTTDYGFCLENVPPGTYELVNNNSAGVTPTNISDTCTYRIAVSDGTTTQYAGESFIRNPYTASGLYYPIGNGVIKLDSFTRNLSVRLEYRLHSATGTCIVRSNPSAASATTKPSITFKPLDNASNSALYVQGPVKAAETGTAIPAGYVGETLYETTSANGGSATVPATTQRTIRVLTIPPGVWLVCGTASVATYQFTSPIRYLLTLHKVPSANGTSGISRVDSPVLTTNETALNAPCQYENNSTNVTYYLVAYVAASSGTATVNGAFIRAIRIN